ncbi:MAG: hypothetical protein O2992_01730 [Gemmatimonadetes bacterium]|jgi:hypothetical protein|nr:hypothetical protein [Gemmatimonadota bacterium]
MRHAHGHLFVPALALSVAFALTAIPTTVSAQANGHAHIGHVADAFRGTPDEMGLLPTAMAEAAIAAQHAGFAANSADNLDMAKRHMGHVLHALDPAEAEAGPGKGYGVKAAAAGVARHIELAAAAEQASDALKTHATHIATSAHNTVTRVDQMIALAKQIQAATSAADAAPMIHELAALGEQLVTGHDANGDGRVGWQEGEGGLAASETHLGLLKRAEGMD